ncbi:cardioacceleratory peptide receptor-like isoform X2 [Planococcus citri]|uniref:cardioacceleratory peptide receptor-like isoform X2 n=1 Tax=Planococcus citri TaxID=170843 RepID=UPI0031FA017C
MAYHNDSKISNSFFEPSVTSYMDGMPFPIADTTIAEYTSFNNATEFNFTLTSTLKPPDPFYFYKTPQFIVLWVLFILIVVGNSSVLIALLKHKGRKSRMNFFIMHLAFADLLVGLVNVLVDIMWRITITWHAGNFGCKLIRYLQVLVTFSSTYVLVALSIDRYDAITRPMKFSGSWRRAKFLVGSAWGLSALFSIPIPILYEEAEIGGRTQCWLDFAQQWQWKVYMTSVACAVFIIPALIIIICYTVIVCTIWSKSSTIVIINPQQRRKSTRGSMIHPRPRKYPEDYESRRASSRGLIPRAKVKTIKMTFVIVFVFIICWSPYFIFDLLQVYGYIPETQTTYALATFIQSLAPLNSAANPVIYCLFSTRTCSTLWKLPPFKWIVSWLSTCFPGLAEGSKRRFNRGCLRYGENSTTMTETITQSSKRSRLTSGTSLRQIVMFKVNSADMHNKNYGKAEVTVV